MHVASAKTVYEAITTAIEDLTSGDSVVSNVETSETGGNIKVTKGGEAMEVTVKDVVTKPTWEPELRKLTLPVAGGEAVVVDIGKDIFLDPEGDNKYDEESDSIILTLNDENSTRIEIPVADFVVKYDGGSGQGTTTEVAGTKINVSIQLDESGSPELSVSESGLKLDLSQYAKTEEITTQINAVNTKVSTLEESVQTNTDAIEILNGGAEEEGSIAKSIADAVKEINDQITQDETNYTELESRVQTIETDNTTNKENIQTNSDNIDALSKAAQWGSFEDEAAE